jgi:thermitase
MTNPGSTPRWPLPDHRSREQIEVDTTAVHRQVTALQPADGAAREHVKAVLERLAQRQRRATDGRPFVIEEPDGRPAPVLVAENQLVVMDGGGARAGLAEGAPAEHPGQFLRVVSRQNATTVEALRDDARTLQSGNTTAHVNLIMPLGYVVKGDSFPAPTAAAGRFPDTPIDGTVRVAIVDTGRSAEDRLDNWFEGVTAAGTDPLDEVAPLNRTDFFAGHGTFTAGIVRQVASTCEIWVYRFTGPDGVGTDADAATMVLKAADDAARDGRRLIINASFGSSALDDVPPLALQAALQYISTCYPEVLVVASAGNDGADEPFYPAAFKQFGVKAVGALDHDLSPAPFSNHGDWVDCSTVGVGVVSTFVEGLLPPESDLGPNIHFPSDAWAVWSGTSFTAPQISGAVAQLCSQRPDLDPQTAFEQLTADRDSIDGFGKVVHILPGTPTS